MHFCHTEECPPCCYCQPLSSTLPVTLLFLHPLAEMLKCCFCGSKGASMTDFHDLQLKEQLLLQQKWEEDVDVDEGNVCDLCVSDIPLIRNHIQTQR